MFLQASCGCQVGPMVRGASLFATFAEDAYCSILNRTASRSSQEFSFPYASLLPRETTRGRHTLLTLSCTSDGGQFGAIAAGRYRYSNHVAVAQRQRHDFKQASNYCVARCTSQWKRSSACNTLPICFHTKPYGRILRSQRHGSNRKLNSRRWCMLQLPIYSFIVFELNYC